MSRIGDRDILSLLEDMKYEGFEPSGGLYRKKELEDEVR